MDAAATSDGRWAQRELAPARWLDYVDTLHARRGFWWLDGALPGTPQGRWSFAGAEPWAELRAWGDRIRLDVHRARHPDFPIGRHEEAGDPLEFAARMLRALDPGCALDPALPFAGGAVGWLGYELAPFADGFTPRAKDGLGLPDLCLLWVDRLIALDPLDGRAVACVRAERGPDAERELADFVSGLSSPVANARAPVPTSAAAPGGERSCRFESLDRSAYEKAVHEIQAAIEQGDVYQACLTHRITVPFRGDPWHAYQILRARNPAPFGAFLQLPEAALLSSSPERFLELSAAGSAESRPIKGTRPRGRTAPGDAELARELAASEKDRAENVMIVDLVRNDLGRVCETGSVHVPELQVIERYATVWQMVSTVRGRVRSGVGPFEAVRATFPPGSMTGAPKRAALRILDRLEPVQRGPYAGALGWFDARGTASLSVVIRTAIVADGCAHVHAGGGIVADSAAEAEWREAEDKARVLLECLAEAAAAEPGLTGPR
ncbi:MAG: aminodeoxychorismate synthase component I [Myxococcales bacterium]|nr:aminodeoxychorismate synthase component I [Myxococcales bacterium]